MDEINLESFFQSITPIVKENQEHREEKELRGDFFNIFSVLNMERDEVHTHSSFIAELLNPKGLHGLKDRFLREFIACIPLKEINAKDLQTTTAEVKKEKYIGKKDVRNETGGDIDILINFTSPSYTIIIENGKLMQKNMKKQKYNITELLEQLRMNGVVKISDVEYAILETSGQLSIILKAPKQPATAEQMLVLTEYEGLPVNIILDGKLVKENLDSAKLTAKDVEKRLAEDNLTIKDVFYANINAKGEYYIQAKQI